jgi:hypothetical protein
VFFRIGGATPGTAATSLVVNNSQVILDDIWAWRADHGHGVGWAPTSFSRTRCRTTRRARQPGWPIPGPTATPHS